MTPFGDEVHPFFSGDGLGCVRFNFEASAIGELAIFADGYHEAGRLLLDTVEESRSCPDYLGYPIFFLYRHALELYFKAILYRRLCYLGLLTAQTVNPDKLLGRHDLVAFLPPLREIFDLVGWKEEIRVQGVETWAEFCSLVSAIEKVDKSSYAFRYPVTKKGDPAMPRHLALNVISFGRGMDPVLEFLGGAESGLEDIVGYANESVYFLKSLADEWRNNDHSTA